MPNNVIIVNFTFAMTAKTSDVDNTLNAIGDDWIRIAFNSWLIDTKRSAENWFHILKAYTDDGSLMFVVEVNLHNSSGWLPTWAWDWINSRQDAQRKAAAEIISRSLAIGPPSRLPPSFGSLLGKSGQK